MTRQFALSLFLIIAATSIFARWQVSSAEELPRGSYRHGVAVDIGEVTVHMQPDEVSRILGPSLHTRDMGQGHTYSTNSNGQDIDFLEGPRGAWIIDESRLTQAGTLLVQEGDSENDVVTALGANHSVGKMMFSSEPYWEYRDKDGVMVVVYFTSGGRVSSVRLAD